MKTAWLRLLSLLASLKVLLGLAGQAVLLRPSGAREWALDLLPVASIVLFTGAGLFLILGARDDRRADYLGGAFLLAASSSATDPLYKLAQSVSGSPADLLYVFSNLNPDAFFPLLLWLFFRDFPRTAPLGLAASIPRFAIAASAVTGIVIFALYASAALLTTSREGIIASHTVNSLTWALIGLLGLPALGFGLWRMRVAPRSERRRMRILLTCLTLGAGPLFLAFLLAAISPAFDRIMRDPRELWTVNLALRFFPLLIPVGAVYAVQVQHVLEVRLVLRKALRYALARYTVLAATAVPFLVVLTQLLLNLDKPLADFLKADQVLGLSLLAGSCIAVLKMRDRVLDRIDQAFFREHYDARQTLLQVADKSRDVDSFDELARILRGGIDEALHLERIEVLFAVEKGIFWAFPEGRAKSFRVSSFLARLLEGSSESLDVDLERPGSTLRRLPTADQEFLADGNYRLLTPLIDSAGALKGVIASGAKLSELGFSSEDRALLGAVAASAAVTLERLSSVRSQKQRDDPRSDATGVIESRSESLAGECEQCRAVFLWSASRCSRCEQDLKPLMLPYVLIGKYRLEKRLGAGGMSVVYLARDLDLGRLVAIKTLPRQTPERSLRLRREARAMASFSHPNLALIYGVEAWRGVPLLILEYLAGGTLQTRLARSRLTSAEVVKLGIALAGVLERSHARGILHRDIKPSNVGFSAEGVAKLLDFGLAKIISEAVQEEASASAPTLTRPSSASTSFLTGPRFVGTPAYSSPEARSGAAPSASFDLWSLAVVLLEALVGFYPLERQPAASLELRPVLRDFAEIARRAPDCPDSLASFFNQALNPDPRQRPRGARSFVRNLEKVGQEL